MEYQILEVSPYDDVDKVNIINLDGEYDLEQMKCIVTGLKLNDLNECTYYIVVEGDSK